MLCDVAATRASETSALYFAIVFAESDCIHIMPNDVTGVARMLAHCNACDCCGTGFMVGVCVSASAITAALAACPSPDAAIAASASNFACDAVALAFAAAVTASYYCVVVDGQPAKNTKLKSTNFFMTLP